MPKPVTPLLTVDAVVLDRRGRVLLIKRGRPPFKGAWALPGGFVDVGETVEAACRRELQEEAGLVVKRLRLVGVYSAPGRDPRGPTVTIAFATRLPAATTSAIAGDDAAEVIWSDQWRSLPLAFDHGDIIRDALARLSTR